MAGECKQFFSRVVKDQKQATECSKQGVWILHNISSSRKQWSKLCTSIEILQTFRTLNHSQMTKKLHT